MIKNAKITITPGYKTGTSVTLDGVDITDGLRGLHVNAPVAGISDTPTLTLDIVAYEIEINGELETRLTPAADHALKILGWTPPGEDRLVDG